MSSPMHETIELLGGPLDGRQPVIPTYTLADGETTTAYEAEIRLYDTLASKGRWRYEYNWDKIGDLRVFAYRGIVR